MYVPVAAGCKTKDPGLEIVVGSKTKWEGLWFYVSYQWHLSHYMSPSHNPVSTPIVNLPSLNK